MRARGGAVLQFEMSLSSLLILIAASGVRSWTTRSHTLLLLRQQQHARYFFVVSIIEYENVVQFIVIEIST